MRKTFYITTPIYYVNDRPHLGHAYTTIAADVLARYHRLRGDDVFFLTGVDEHGQKVQQAAAKAGVDPKTHCDRLARQFQQLWQTLNISHDAFIRTTDASHQRIVQRTLQSLFDKKLIYRAEYTGWYCTFDERFWTEKDVVQPEAPTGQVRLCPDCRRPVEWLSETNYFFKMGRYQDQLLRYIEAHPDFIRPESRRNEVLGFLKTQVLGDLSISRPKTRLFWGIELPFDRDYVTYVWFDALVNYLSGPEYLAQASTSEHYWPANVHLVGKDILTTHAVYWSTMLMALELPLPQTIFAHGWWTVDGEKMSKSRGNVVDPMALVEECGVDAFRYFLLREVPFGQDGDFSREALVRRTNSELANGIGNLVSRTLTMIERYCGGTIPEVPRESVDQGGDRYRQLRFAKDRVLALEGHLDHFFRNFAFHELLQQITSRVTDLDVALETHEPWKLAKDPHKRLELHVVLYTVSECLRILSLYLYPFMPNTAQRLAHQLGLTVDFRAPLLSHGIQWGGLPSGTMISRGSALFPRIDVKSQGGQPMHHEQPTSVSPPPEVVPQITIEDFKKIQLKVAKVVSAERIPKSEKLIKLLVDLGSEQRQIVAGIGRTYAPEDLLGRRIVIVANLKPAKLMGVESQGMVLAAGDTEVKELLTLTSDVEPGTTVK
jgi:methionyl-tRNA synthetase